MSDKTATHEPPAAPTEDKPICDYCGMPFDPYRANQRFCCPEHRKAFERIIHRIAGRLYPEIRDGVREILNAHRQEDT